VYAVAPGVVKVLVPLIDETTTIDPPPACFRYGTLVRILRKVPVKLTAIVLFHSSSFRSSIGAHAIDAGVGHDDIKPAEISDEVIDGLDQLQFIGNVGRQGTDFPASRTNFFSSGGNFALCMSEETDTVSLSRKRHRG
jgi:hypothetical protein